MNERHEQFKQTMRAVGARCINECNGPDNTQPITSRLEFWGVPGKGLLIAQLWNDGGVTTYVDWPTGSTWEDLQSLLTATEQPDNEDAQEILAILKQAQKDAEAVRRAATTLLEQRRKLVVACRALVQELKCYTEVHKADEDDEQALTLAAEALRGLQ